MVQLHKHKVTGFQNPNPHTSNTRTNVPTRGHPTLISMQLPCDQLIMFDFHSITHGYISGHPPILGQLLWAIGPTLTDLPCHPPSWAILMEITAPTAIGYTLRVTTQPSQIYHGIPFISILMEITASTAIGYALRAPIQPSQIYHAFILKCPSTCAHDTCNTTTMTTLVMNHATM